MSAKVCDPLVEFSLKFNHIKYLTVNVNPKRPICLFNFSEVYGGPDFQGVLCHNSHVSREGMGSL